MVLSNRSHERIHPHLKIDWFAYFNWVNDNPSFIEPMQIAYDALGLVYFAGLIYLILAGDFERA
ncbi:MAG: hypothetical protein AAFW70_27235, partial [Cyanobacteria bacterium J06635_10]